MFAKCYDWLIRQPGMNPIETGQTKLCEQIDTWLADYSESICEQVVNSEHDHHGKFVGRLWDCWGHHWEQAAKKADNGQIDGLVVAERIQSGRGYARGQQLGGDPLRDVVLAVAMVAEDNRAPICFEQDYYEFSKGIAGKKLGPQYRANADDWWGDFLVVLAGYTGSAPKLDSFGGHCALRNWLGTVLWNFLREWIRLKANRPLATDDEQLPQIAAEPEELADDASRDECRDLFARLVRRALEMLPVQDRLILLHLYLDKMPLKDIARVLGIHAGNAGRRRDRVIRRLRELVDEEVAKAAQEQAFEDCLETIMDGSGRGPKDFADALCAALKASVQEEEKKQ